MHQSGVGTHQPLTDQEIVLYWFQMNEDLCFLSASKAAKHIQARDISPVELTEAYLARIEVLQPKLDAFITLTSKSARTQARKAESEIVHGNYRGPLHGIPVGLKDVYDAGGILTTGNSRICAENEPRHDSTCWRKLREGGAILLGKLTTHELAHGGPAFDLPWPPARNPWNLEHFTGGSSSGSAAATSAGLVAVALGTDTGGSIRAPASMCGIVGMMATSGLVSRAGVIPNSFTFDRCGPMARTVEDCALVLQQIAGFDGQDPGSLEVPIPDYQRGLGRSVKDMRIGVLRHVWEEDVPQPDEVCCAIDEAIRCFEQLGVKMEDVRVRPALEYNDVKVVVGESEIFSVHYRDLVKRPGDFCDDTLTRMLPALLFQTVDYVQATREHRRMIQECGTLQNNFDALLSTVVGPAPRLETHDPLGFWERPHACAMANVLGGPAIGLPIGFAKQGLPMGMQLIGFPFQEAKLLQLAYAYQRETEWHSRRPPLNSEHLKPVVTRQVQTLAHRDIPEKMKELVCLMAEKARLRLNDHQMQILLSAAPSALAMADRVRRMHERDLNPAHVFRLTQ